MEIALTPILVAFANELIPNLAGIAITIALGFLTPIVSKYVGNANALALQGRVNELFNKGISYAVTQTSDAITKQGYTIQTSNVLAKLAAQYVADHAPDLAKQVGATLGQLEEKALARIPSHPDVQAAVAGSAPPDTTH